MSRGFSTFDRMDIKRDTPGGLMPQIQALIAPPPSTDVRLLKLKRDREERRHIYFKRPGRGHNRDSCDACHDGGELICCDHCPASFHLQCHDPPLEMTDVPNGQWMCHACKNASKRVEMNGNKKKKKNALEVLTLAASLSNPREFTLPRELQLPITFPGTDKIDPVSYKKGRAQNSTALNGKIHYYESGNIIPLPARFCFECGRSCKKAPLVACDYCPLYFHQDCLDPPLTAFPSGRWMCPNHSNHFIDQNLLTSCAATERMKLWDKFAHQQIDQHSVKLDFLRKAHAINPPFRIKMQQSQKNRVKVPSSVKYHYANPPELDKCQFYRPATFLHSYTKEENNKIEEIDEQFEEIPVIDEEEVEEETVQVEYETDSVKMEIVTIEEPVKYENDIDLTDIDHDHMYIKDNNSNKFSEKNHKADNNEVLNDNGVEVVIDNEVIKQKDNKVSETDKLLEDNIFVKSGLGFNIKEGISLLERPVLEALAQQRLEQILNPANEIYENVNSGSKARALLFPLGQTVGPPVFMTGKTVNIGTGGDSDLVLSRYGHCSSISPKHAVIFFDKLTRRYELLNYSEYGTLVDNVLYSCDSNVHLSYSESDSHRDISRQEAEAENFIKNLAKKTGSSNPRASSNANFKEHSCKCMGKRKGPNGNFEEGWEGSALIDHGSILSFGCLTFVFSTVDKFTNR